MGASGAALPTYLRYAEFAQREFAPDALVILLVGNDFDVGYIQCKQSPGCSYFEHPRAEGDPPTIQLREWHGHSWPVRLARNSAVVRYLIRNAKLTPASFLARVMVSGSAHFGNTLADSGEERLDAGRKAVEYFFELLPAKSGLPADRVLVVLDALRRAIYDPALSEAADASFFGEMRAEVKRIANERGYEVLDMQSAFSEHFRRHQQRFEFLSDGHWNSLAHQIAAEEIQKSSVWRRALMIDPSAGVSERRRAAQETN